MKKKKETIGIIPIQESYTSLLLGIIVVIAFAFLALSFAKSKGIIKNFIFSRSQSISSSKTTKSDITNLKQQIIYTVLEGDDLGIISAKFYNTGEYWNEIAKANKLENPDLLEAGTKLIIPQIKISQPIDQSLSITASTYTVQEGEDLWGIALRAYGDAYAWTKIAEANNLSQPDAISAGTVLKIPR